MSDHYFTDVRAKRFNALHRPAFPAIPRFLIAGTFALFSMAAFAQQTARERTTATSEWPLGTRSIPQSTSQPDRPGLDTSQPQTRFECGRVAREEPGTAGQSPTARLLENAEKKRDITKFNCLISAQQAHEGLRRQEIVLIDVRRSSEFEKYQISGSLNLAPFSIKAKPFLKNKRVVLVNEGRHLAQLESLCNRLIGDGFKQVSVMAGGLYAWHQAGYPIAGERLEIGRLSLISPTELIASLPERDWKFIDLDRSLPSLANLLPASSVIEYQADNEAFISAVNQANSEFNDHSLPGFLVVNGKGDDYKSVERLLHLTDAKNIFYLAGGITELKRTLNTHSSLISRVAKGFEEPHRCGG